MTDTAQLDAFKDLLARKIGLRVPADAHDRFVGMLHEHAACRGYATLAEYRHFLLDDDAAAEWEAFARMFSSAETFFFRDHGQFDLLRLRLLPELIARHRRDKTLRLWSAGCASGEEAYSLAMLVDFLLPERGDWNLLILGTDIDSKAIAKARRGRYGQWSFRMVPKALRQRYFHPEGQEWVLDERIRRMATFRVSNLVGERFPALGSELHDMDLILCRNVFIYFDPAAVSAVAAKLAATLTEGGYLLTAHTELNCHPVRELESELFAEGLVYRKQSLPAAYAAPPPAAAKIAPLPPPLIPGAETREKPIQARSPAVEHYASARERADRGEYDRAETMCREALTEDPLLAGPYFLLAQLAQLKEDFEQAKEYLNKAIYLDRGCVAAYLELAALHERAGDAPRAQALRHAALEIVRTLPSDRQIEEYERTAGELAQWLAQGEALPNPRGNIG